MFNFNPQLATTWEDSPDKGLSTLSWPMGMFRSVWVAPFPMKRLQNCLIMEKFSGAQAIVQSVQACIPPPLILAMDVV